MREFGSTCAIFPIDGETIRYLKLSGRDEARIEVVEAYAKAQGLWREDGQADALYTDTLELDLDTVEPCIAGHRGRVVKTTGGRATRRVRQRVDAVRCTVASQEGMAERNGGLNRRTVLSLKFG